MSDERLVHLRGRRERPPVDVDRPVISEVGIGREEARHCRRPYDSSIHTGAWSLVFSQPRTSRSTPAPMRRGNRSGLIIDRTEAAEQSIPEHRSIAPTGSKESVGG